MTGLWISALLYFTAAISVKAFVIVWFGMSVASVASSIVFIIATLQDKNSKLALVGGALLLTSVAMLAGSISLACDVFASGNKGATEFCFWYSISNDFKCKAKVYIDL